MQQLKMIVDNRERNLQILESLSGMGVEMAFSQLPVGDYIISDRLCIERKTFSDFENSIMNARLFDQMQRLHESFAKPILLIEGSPAESRLGAHVMLGAIMKLYVDYNTQVIMSADEQETAYILSRFAEHEQKEEKREPRLVGLKKAYTDDQWQILILSSIPGIGAKLARKLIAHFKTIRGVASADVEQLEEVEKIGKKKAERIYSILNAEFNGN
jgi:ERCC4-type nuclease